MEKHCYYQLKVTLQEAKPPIWRRIVLSPEKSLLDLHKIIQSTMGWDNAHLFLFRQDGVLYGHPEEDGLEVRDCKEVSLKETLQEEKDTFLYEYDFGDAWEHKIVLEKILWEETIRLYPECVAGKNACPPEDCGGVFQFNAMLPILKDPTHEEYHEISQWVGADYDPDFF